jgi:hypothetical protein
VTIRKISLEDMEVFRKYRVQTRNYCVARQVEEFTCGSHAVLYRTDKMIQDKMLGISKKEIRVSNRNHINGHLGLVNGGS